jgi:hypothetical protein
MGFRVGITRTLRKPKREFNVLLRDRFKILSFARSSWWLNLEGSKSGNTEMVRLAVSDPRSDRPDGLQYNSRGAVMGLDTFDTMPGALTLIFGIALPIIVTSSKFTLDVHPVLLQRTSTFGLLIARGLLSEFQVFETEILLLLLVVTRVLLFPYYKAKQAGRYSKDTPAPHALRMLWPKQIWFRAIVGAGGIVLAFFSGLLVSWNALPENYVNVKLAFGAITLLSVGICFFTEGILNWWLYRFYYFRYWRKEQ